MKPPDPVTAIMHTNTDSVLLYNSEVMHRRLFPVNYRFSYRIFNLLIDVDRLAQADGSSRLFSINRFNLFSFHASDHLPEGGHDLRQWAEKALAEFGIDRKPAKIQILCLPRILGRVFNPLSIWYCSDENGEPIAIICEVRNTFGEKHHYLLHQDQQPMIWPVRQHHAKEFHVSPFIGMQADYEFRISQPLDRATVGIREYQDNKLMLVATLVGHRKPFNSWNLIIQSLRVPLQTVKVLAAIHWHALWIWLAGAPFHFKPAPPEKEIT